MEELARARLTGGTGRSRRRIATALAWLVALLLLVSGLDGRAQQPAPGTGWDTGTRIDRPPEKQPRPQPGPPGSPANTTVVPRAPGDVRPAAPMGEVRLEAFLTDDAQRIEQGLLWHVFDDPPVPADGAAALRPKLIGSWREAAPVLRLPAGTYHVTATFGRAHLMRRVTLKAGASVAERFVLSAGGLRITAVGADGKALPEIAFAYDVLTGDADSGGLRSKVVGGLKPGVIIRLNSGIYQVVSTYGDTNSVVRSDVTVEAGKLTEAVITHNAARVTFKLVNRPGGDAIADTRWTIRTVKGEKVRDSNGALPSHILSAGAYEVTAQNGERALKKSFVVAAGSPLQIEVVLPPAGQ